MTTEKLYTIVVEYYKTKRDVEEGKPNRTGESGFKPMPLQAAIVCKSKMSELSSIGKVFKSRASLFLYAS